MASEYIARLEGPKGLVEILEVARPSQQGDPQTEYEVELRGAGSQIALSLKDAYTLAKKLTGLET